MRCEPFRDRSSGAALPDLAWRVFHLELNSLGEQVAALGYAARRPSDFPSAARRASVCVPAHQAGGSWHLLVHICPRISSPPSPRQLRNGPYSSGRGPWGAGGGGQSSGLTRKGCRRPRCRLSSPALGRQGCRFFVPPRSPSFVFLTYSWLPSPTPARGVCAVRGGVWGGKRGADSRGGRGPSRQGHAWLSSGCTWRESWGPPAGLRARGSHYCLPAPPGRIYIRATHLNFYSPPPPVTGRTRAGSEQAPARVDTRAQAVVGWGARTGPGVQSDLRETDCCTHPLAPTPPDTVFQIVL